jgi:hypothetical protein
VSLIAVPVRVTGQMTAWRVGSVPADTLPTAVVTLARGLA